MFITIYTNIYKNIYIHNGLSLLNAPSLIELTLQRISHVIYC